jgi:hypothetical protein
MNCRGAMMFWCDFFTKNQSTPDGQGLVTVSATVAVGFNPLAVAISPGSQSRTNAFKPGLIK